MTLLVGIDAGASHTEAVAGRSPEDVLARWRGAPGAVRPGEETQAGAIFVEAVRGVIEQAGLSEPASSIVVGAAGTGREESRLLVEQFLGESLGGVTEVRVTTDGEIALEAAFPDGPGIVVTAGSGSIAYARDGQGQLFKVGGLGWRIGDEGSGYALGRAALQALGQAAEGRGEATELSDRLFAAVDIQTLDQLVKWSLAATPREIASLAREVILAADEGDEVAIELVDEAAVELALHIEALLPSLTEVRPIRVAFNGGILSPTSAVRESLTAILEETQPELVIVHEPVDPPVGALRLAAG